MLVATLIAAVLLSAWPPSAAAAAPTPTPAPYGNGNGNGNASSCQRRCGDLEIPFPFGIGRGCYHYTGEGDITFELTCRRTAAGGGHQAFCGDAVEVTNISVRHGQATINSGILAWCYNRTSRSMVYTTIWDGFDLTDSQFTLSDEGNRFVVVGCNSLAYVYGTAYMTGCMATCPDAGTLEKGSCTGMGCCQAAIPRGINTYGVQFDDRFNTSAVTGFSPCSYAVLMEAAAFEFRTTYVTTGDFLESTGGKVPLLLDWVVGKETCGEAVRNATAYMCVSSNSDCVDSRNGPGGYLCNCSAGYQGNPYIPAGCQDINECEDPNKYPCSVPGTCTNTPGSFTCSCPDKTTGNAYNGTCEANKSQLGVRVAVGVSAGMVVLVVTMSCAYMVRQKRSLAAVKQRYFKQHGGLLLFEEMKSKQGLSFTLFTEEELEEASGGFDERSVLGKGGSGTVYKGALKDGRDVAIKRCKLVGERQEKEFGKEMLILSQVNHRNVVRLYGCCLEVEVPMLVYEFVPNGTLYHLIHGHGGSRVSLATRLKIAHEAAEALAYLHSWASPPIIHGDVKSPNILIDESYAAKVSDFGASTLAPTDEAQFVTFVQGTYGYLDPEYMQTSKLTSRSDVYSFGVVLLELLTCRKATNLQALDDEEINLSAQFLRALGEKRLDEILDQQIKGEQSMELLEQVAELAKKCLEMASDKRPSMPEVAEELDRVRRKLSQNPWGWGGHEEIFDEEELKALLVGSPGTGTSSEIVELSTNAYVSTTDSAYLGIQSPR